MDHSYLQAALRREALSVARQNAQNLKSRLSKPGAQRSESASRKVRYLERVLAEVGSNQSLQDFVAECQGLCARYSRLPLTRRSVGAVLEELSATTGTPSPDSAERTDDGVQAQELLAGSFGSTRSALARFLFPQLSLDEAEDEVRLMALEGKLTSELSQHARLTNVGLEHTVFLRSWKEGGQAGALGEPGDEAAATEVMAMSFSPAAGAQVLDLGGGSPNPDCHRWEWLVGATGLAIGIGTAVFLHVPAGMGILALTSGAGAGVKAVGKWQEKVLVKMKQQLPRALKPMQREDADRLRGAALRQQRLLLKALSDSGSWRPYWFSPRALRLGLPILWRPSQVRKAGAAFATHFQTGLPARSVHALLERLSVSCSLDPGCQAVWARPVDEEGTSIRYAVFSSSMGVLRDFFLLCHSGKAEGVSGTDADTDMGTGAGTEAGAVTGAGAGAGAGQGRALRRSASEQAGERSPGGVPPFCHRDRTHDFQRLRAQLAEQRAQESPHKDRLRTAVARCETAEVLRLCEAVRATRLRGSSASTLSRSRGRCETCQAVTLSSCEICLRWCCEACLGRRSASELLPDTGPRTGSDPHLLCCAACSRFLDALLWQRQPPPACLPAVPAGLLQLHTELSGNMTQLSASLAQLEGLYRTLSGPDSCAPPFFECWQQLPLTCAAVDSAKASLERTLQRLSVMPCKKPSDQQLRERLCSLGREHLMTLKPAIVQAEEEADKCMQRCPVPDLASSWVAGRSLAERYALSLSSCPPHLLNIAGEEAVPTPDGEIQHGSVHLMGVIVTDTANGGSRVDVIADVDPGVPLTFYVDLDVRGHVLFTADRLRREILEEEARLHSDTMAHRMADLSAITDRLPASA